MTIRSEHTLLELREIVLLSLRSVPGCENVSDVTIEKVRVIGTGPRWDVSTIEPGLGNEEIASRALQVLNRLRQEFELKV
jgi:hypothetical protein